MSVIAPLVALRPEAEPPLPAAHEALRVRTPPRGEAARRDPTPLRAVVAAVVEPVLASAPGPIVDPSAWFEDSSVAEARPLPPSPAIEAPAQPALRIPAPIDLPAPSAALGPGVTPPIGLPVMRGRPGESGSAARRGRRAPERLDDDQIEAASGAGASQSYGAGMLEHVPLRPPVGGGSSSEALRELDRDRETAPRGRVLSAADYAAPAIAVAAPRAIPGEVPSLVDRSSPLKRALIAVVICLLSGAAVGWLLSTPEPPTADELRARSVQAH